MTETRDLWVQPMAATSATVPFSGADWVFERKLDGVRALAIRAGGRTRLMSRNRNDVSASYPEIVAALDAASDVGEFVLDGEIVAFDGDRTSFAELQKRIHQTDPRRIDQANVPVYYYLFDLLHWDGHDARALGLRDRKSLLRDALEYEDPLRYSEHRDEYGEEMRAEASEHDWEGVIAKRAGSTYRSGRSDSWVKVKRVREQELVVGGFTPPTGSRRVLGALLVGHYGAGGLEYAGKVGTGFTDDDLERLRVRLEPIEQSAAPFTEPPGEKGARWVRPELVVQVAFGEWTSAGRLRHPSFKGIRTDKHPRDVVREDAPKP